ncbi:hypothetical protein BMS3Abin03_02753 [bacterium BMS3Abin03]|nr:hypothetical protein BMS3Abin03_02753 [bacterium BMS3Abin03]
MRFLLFALLIISLVQLGCSESSNFLTDPAKSYPELVKLPPRSSSSLSTETLFSVSKTIQGKHGGTIIIDESYESEDGQTVTIYGKLKIPKHSFQGTKTITMTIDDEFAAVHFEPTMDFNKSLKLDLEFTGLDLENLGFEDGKWDFAFISDDGEIEIVKKKGMSIDISDGELSVEKAKLNHFSRYGWCR